MAHAVPVTEFNLSTQTIHVTACCLVIKKTPKKTMNMWNFYQLNPRKNNTKWVM